MAMFSKKYTPLKIERADFERADLATQVTGNIGLGETVDYLSEVTICAITTIHTTFRKFLRSGMRVPSRNQMQQALRDNIPVSAPTIVDIFIQTLPTCRWYCQFVKDNASSDLRVTAVAIESLLVLLKMNPQRLIENTHYKTIYQQLFKLKLARYTHPRVPATYVPAVVNRLLHNAVLSLPNSESKEIAETLYCRSRLCVAMAQSLSPTVKVENLTLA